MTHLMELPDELLEAVLEFCDSPTLLRVMKTCCSLNRLAGNEDLWETRLADLWKDKCEPARGLRRWWLCELTRSRDGVKETRAVPSPCADSPALRTLRECSFRESYKASVLDAARTLMSEEELLGHVWSLAPPAEEVVAAHLVGDPIRDGSEHLAIFRADGTYVDSLGVHAPWELHPPPAGAKYPPPAVNVARVGPHFISRTDDWGWALTNVRRGVLAPAAEPTAVPAPTGTGTGAGDDAPSRPRVLRSLRRRVTGCVVIGLPHRPEINGAFCAVEEFCDESGEYAVRIEEPGGDDAALVIDEDGAPARVGSGEVHYLAPEHVALPKGARVRLLSGRLPASLACLADDKAEGKAVGKAVGKGRRGTSSRDVEEHVDGCEDERGVLRVDTRYLSAREEAEHAAESEANKRHDEAIGGGGGEGREPKGAWGHAGRHAGWRSGQTEHVGSSARSSERRV